MITFNLKLRQIIMSLIFLLLNFRISANKNKISLYSLTWYLDVNQTISDTDVNVSAMRQSRFRKIIYLRILIYLTIKLKIINLIPSHAATLVQREVCTASLLLRKFGISSMCPLQILPIWNKSIINWLLNKTLINQRCHKERFYECLVLIKQRI